jgi:N utilization substance protein B
MQNDQPPQENNELNPVARHNARRYALQAMYQWQVTDTPITELEHSFILNHIVKKTDLNYFKELIHGIYKNKSELDAELEAYIGRPLREIDPVELAVLRIGTYEILKRPDVPYRVVINEALELTKKFGSIEGHKFVNGVLDKVARKHRATEVKMRK